jgi:hypothetical protein
VRRNIESLVVKETKVKQAEILRAVCNNKNSSTLTPSLVKTQIVQF